MKAPLDVRIPLYKGHFAELGESDQQFGTLEGGGGGGGGSFPPSLPPPPPDETLKSVAS